MARWGDMQDGKVVLADFENRKDLMKHILENVKLSHCTKDYLSHFQDVHSDTIHRLQVALPGVEIYIKTVERVLWEDAWEQEEWDGLVGALNSKLTVLEGTKGVHVFMV